MQNTVFVPREVKPQEFRVAVVPGGAEELVLLGVRVLIEAGAGAGSGFSDGDYTSVGAEVVRREEGFAAADLVFKVKEPTLEEVECLRRDTVLFCYLHLAANVALAEALSAKSVSALAYETLRDKRGRLPLLTPMSEVAGRLAVQEGARHLLRPFGGPGILLGGVTGTSRSHVTVIGGGVVGAEAARVSAGLGANVHILDKDLERLAWLRRTMPDNVTSLFSSRQTLLEELAQADLVVGAVLAVGARAPRMISRQDLRLMKAGSVLVDVAIDQGGIAETSRPTSHEAPTFVEEGVTHYCVSNIPGAAPRTSTLALSNATLPYVRLLSELGLRGAIEREPQLVSAVNLHGGRWIHPAVAKACDRMPSAFEVAHLRPT